MARYLKDRDSSALDASMHRLDAQEQAMRERAVPDEVPAEVAVGYLRELSKTWQEAQGGQGRALLARALFERIDVLGMSEATVTLTEHASRHGFGAVLPEEFGISVSGRGERSRAAANPLIRDLGPTSPQGPRVREHGRRQATAALGALCMRH